MRERVRKSIFGYVCVVVSRTGIIDVYAMVTWVGGVQNLIPIMTSMLVINLYN